MEYFGKVAKCKHGKIGVIFDVRKPNIGTMDSDDRWTYYGVSLDGSKWQSKDPEIISDNIRDFIKLAVVDANKIEENVKYYRGY